MLEGGTLVVLSFLIDETVVEDGLRVELAAAAAAAD